jgi:NADPH:quinone reductase-like Zn-dependent oxidoreductase
LPRSLQALAILGQVNLIGVLTGLRNDVDVGLVVFKTARVQGIYVGSRAMLEHLMQEVAAKRIRPVIDKIFPFDEAAEAYRYLESAQHFGKIVIQI